MKIFELKTCNNLNTDHEFPSDSKLVYLFRHNNQNNQDKYNGKVRFWTCTSSWYNLAKP